MVVMIVASIDSSLYKTSLWVNPPLVVFREEHYYLFISPKPECFGLLNGQHLANAEELWFCLVPMRRQTPTLQAHLPHTCILLGSLHKHRRFTYFLHGANAFRPLPS